MSSKPSDRLDIKSVTMGRHRKLWIYTIIFITGWVLAIVLLLTEHATLPLFLSVIIPIFIVVVIVQLKYITVSKKNIDSLTQLSKAIIKWEMDEKNIIDQKQFPPELQEVVQSLNHLHNFYYERYQNERDFTANASHELRTPLAGIRLQSEVALRTSDQRQQELALKNVIKAVDRGTRLVEQLLILSRLTYERIDLMFEPFSLNEIVRNNIDELQNLFKNKSIYIRYNDDQKIDIVANRESMSILVNNLLRNAIKYVPYKSDIEIELHKTTEGIVFIVSDWGPGIPEEDRGRVLKRFEKASFGNKLSSGLGLAIVKRIVDLHSGDININPTSGKMGLTVTVRIPQKR